jgi:outer membrane protein assembly factor BamB
MWHRSSVALALTLALTLPAAAQVSNVYSRATPPDKAALERLNLKIEWTANIPVEGRRDSLTQIQTLGDQIFVQTRTGLLIAGDALTGELQWFKQLGDGDYANTYPVAANSEYVFAAHVTKLHCFHRYTGVVEYVTELGSPPTTGLAADESGVYCVLGMRTGSSGAHRIAVYDLPRPIAIAGVPRVSDDPNRPAAKDPRAANPVDNLMTRYAPEHMYRTNLPDVFEPSRIPAARDVSVGGFTASRSPSLTTLPRVTPPYTLQNEYSSPSIGLLPSLRQPYRLRNDFQKDIQRTPSISTIPPSVAAALALTDLRPQNVQAPLRWEYGLTSQLLYPLFLTPTRVWGVTDAKMLLALNKRDKKLEVLQRLADPISAPPGRAGMMVYVPLGSGYIVAVEGTSGSLEGGANIIWRTPVGGIANRSPFVTDKFVYASGDNSGVVCLSRDKGEVVWRSDSTADRLIAANNEFVYVRDRQGRFLVYDAKRPTNPATHHSAPLAGLDLAEFNVNVVNTASDRIYLAADNGLIVCLRDMSPKYARPVRITPEATINALPRATVDAAAKGGEPKKEPEMKEPEKK